MRRLPALGVAAPPAHVASLRPPRTGGARHGGVVEGGRETGL